MPEANPVSNLPIISISTFVAIAIRTQPMAPGMAASFIVFSLPMLSIRKPPMIEPAGTITTITLAAKESKCVKK